MTSLSVIELIKIIVPLVMQYGLPAVIAIIEEFKVEEITEEHIAKLKALVKPPEEYLK